MDNTNKELANIFFQELVQNEINRKKLIKSAKNNFKEIPNLGETVNFKLVKNNDITT